MVWFCFQKTHTFKIVALPPITKYISKHLWDHRCFWVIWEPFEYFGQQLFWYWNAPKSVILLCLHVKSYFVMKAWFRCYSMVFCDLLDESAMLLRVNFVGQMLLGTSQYPRKWLCNSFQTNRYLLWHLISLDNVLLGFFLPWKSQIYKHLNKVGVEKVFFFFTELYVIGGENGMNRHKNAQLMLSGQAVTTPETACPNTQNKQTFTAASNSTIN